MSHNCRIYRDIKRSQDGHIYEKNGAFHLRYYTAAVRDGTLVRVQKSKRLIAKTGRLTPASKPVQDAGKAIMLGVFQSRNGTPVNLHNMIARVMVPHLRGEDECVRCGRVPEKTDLVWKGLYAGRRGACIFAVEVTGNYAVAQALLRHKSMTTTLNVYKKAITAEAFATGMKLLEGAMMKSK